MPSRHEGYMICNRELIGKEKTCSHCRGLISQKGREHGESIHLFIRRMHEKTPTPEQQFKTGGGG
jgi:hypothetical protein